MQLKNISVMMAAGIGFVCGANAYGSLLPSVFTDTSTDLLIEWEWDEFGVGGVRVDDLNVPALVNWDASLATFFLPLSPPPVGSWRVDISARHITDPHATDVGGGLPVSLMMGFDETTFLGAFVVPGAADTVSHPDIHSDSYTMEIFHSTSGVINIVRLTGTHNVPGPGSLSLLGLGGLVAIRRRR